MNVLQKLTALEKEATEFGLKWENPNQIIEQIRSECLEIVENLKDNDQEMLQEEIGDLMHAVFSLCVFCKFDPTTTLESSVDKFERRFTVVKQIAFEQELKSLNGQSFDTLMKIWDQAKQIGQKS